MGNFATEPFGVNNKSSNYTKNCFYYCFIFHVALFWTFYSLVFYILY
ncbi:hypothetical protein LK231_0688 [Lactococcus lactis subsp. lactis]|nr:hypothetical protein LK231_0688 [Lactococcus lactis subsp. lactis]